MHQCCSTVLSALISCVSLVGAAVLVCKMLEVFCFFLNCCEFPLPTQTHTPLFPWKCRPSLGEYLVAFGYRRRAKDYSCHPLHPCGEEISEACLCANATGVAALHLPAAALRLTRRNCRNHSVSCAMRYFYCSRTDALQKQVHSSLYCWIHRQAEKRL